MASSERLSKYSRIAGAAGMAFFLGSAAIQTEALAQSPSGHLPDTFSEYDTRSFGERLEATRRAFESVTLNAGLCILGNLSRGNVGRHLYRDNILVAKWAPTDLDALISQGVPDMSAEYRQDRGLVLINSVTKHGNFPDQAVTSLTALYKVNPNDPPGIITDTDGFRKAIETATPLAINIQLNQWFDDATQESTGIETGMANIDGRLISTQGVGANYIIYTLWNNEKPDLKKYSAGKNEIGELRDIEKLNKTINSVSTNENLAAQQLVHDSSENK